MKSITIAVLLVAIAPAAAFAQSTSAPSGMSNNVVDTASQSTAGQWAPSADSASKTRAQVYGELVQAQQDGQMAYLNKTLYAHH
jgi:ABC-type transporter MlaC component